VTEIHPKRSNIQARHSDLVNWAMILVSIQQRSDHPRDYDKAIATLKRLVTETPKAAWEQ